MASPGDPAAPAAASGTNWERASEWLTGICVVTFDLELGQALELIYPDHIQLDEKEKMNICYLSFPDSNSGCMGNSKFHIKIRSRFKDSQRQLKASLMDYNHVCPQWNQRAEASHLYGFVYFRQQKNAQIKRGYFQKSIVLLTRLPFHNLFYKLSDLIAPIFFQQPTEMDRTVLLSLIFQEIGRWPSVRDLLPQKVLGRADALRLKILNKVFQINPLNANATAVVMKSNVPEDCPMEASTTKGSEGGGGGGSDEDLESSICSQNATEGGGGIEIETISLQEIDLFRHLECIIKELHLLWELVITNEPIIVIGNSPSISSQVVQSLVSLISPLFYCGEVRPYFTIHDSEFREFTQIFNSEEATNGGGGSANNTRLTTRRNLILGVTNPFFIKTLKDFPHTIRLDSQTASQGAGVVNGAEFLQQSFLKTSHKRFLQNDKLFVKKIQNGIKLKRPSFVQTLLIQRHFHELTQSFLFPLERYLSLLMPLKREINPFKLDPPQPRPFVEAEFLLTIEKNGPQLTSTLKGDWSGLYRKFLKSPNFEFWVGQRVTDQRKELQLLHLETLTAVDVKTWALGKAEVEIVDLVLKIRQKLNFLQKEFLREELNGAGVSEQIKGMSLRGDAGEEGGGSPVDSNRTTVTSDDPRQRFFSLKKLLVDQSEKLKSLLPEDLKNIL